MIWNSEKSKRYFEWFIELLHINSTQKNRSLNHLKQWDPDVRQSQRLTWDSLQNILYCLVYDVRHVNVWAFTLEIDAFMLATDLQTRLIRTYLNGKELFIRIVYISSLKFTLNYSSAVRTAKEHWNSISFDLNNYNNNNKNNINSDM